MTKKSEINLQIAEAAADWAVKVSSGALTASQRADLNQWLKQSPVHVDEYLFSCALLTGTEYSEVNLPDDLDMLAHNAPEEILSSPPNHAAKKRRSGPLRHLAPWLGSVFEHRSLQIALASLAVIALVVSVATIGSIIPPGNDLIVASTDIGERKTLNLPDGSTITVNAQSKTEVEFSKQMRLVRMIEGEAYFDVSKDPRPFVILTDGLSVSAVGTAFNVRQRNSDTQVEVSEGAVLINIGDHIPSNEDIGSALKREEGSQTALQASSALLSQGERAQFDPVTNRLKIGNVSPDSIAAWRDNKLIFEDAPLSDIVAEFNRYNRIKLVVTDPKIELLRISAVFQATDPRSFADFLSATGDVVVAEDQNQLRLSAAR